MHNTLKTMRESGEKPYLWSGMKRAEAKHLTQHFVYADAVRIINKSKKEEWEATPAYYDVLATIVEEHHKRPDGDL